MVNNGKGETTREMDGKDHHSHQLVEELARVLNTYTGNNIIPKITSAEKENVKRKKHPDSAKKTWPKKKAISSSNRLLKHTLSSQRRSFNSG